MKKVLALMLTVVLALSLVSCAVSNGGEKSKYTTENMAGIWYSDSDISLRLLKGGTAQIVDYEHNYSKWSADIRASWEIKDDCIVVKAYLSGGEPLFYTFEIVNENTIKYLNDINSETVLERQ